MRRLIFVLAALLASTVLTSCTPGHPICYMVYANTPENHPRGWVYTDEGPYGSWHTRVGEVFVIMGYSRTYNTFIYNEYWCLPNNLSSVADRVANDRP